MINYDPFPTENLNVENVKALRAALTIDPVTKKSPALPALGFNMIAIGPREVESASYINVDDKLDNCNTVCCFAGWCSILARPDLFTINEERGTYERNNAEDWRHLDQVEIARNWLGLNNYEAGKLFALNTEQGILENITISEALQVLDHLIETGEIAWGPVYVEVRHRTAMAGAGMVDTA